MNTLERELSTVKPHLKLGTILLPRTKYTYVGRPDRGLEISSPARRALAVMDGSRTCSEISDSLGIPLLEILDLVSELDHANLIDTQASKISVHTRFHSPNANRASHDSDDSHDGAFQQLQARLLPELSSTTWINDVRDGGVSIIDRRRDWHVGIDGNSRIATLLYGILLASGISQTSLHGGNESRRIKNEDLCAGFLHPGDIGLPYRTRIQELSRDLALFPIAPAIKDHRDKSREIMVAVGNTPAHQLQKWMSEGVPYLLIDLPESASISLGPIVIPGQSPCARCIALTREDQNPAWREISMQKLLQPGREVPVAIAHHVAGFAALELLRFIDEGQSQLIGSSVRIDFHQPTMSVQQSFTRHPACGCNW